METQNLLIYVMFHQNTSSKKIYKTMKKLKIATLDSIPLLEPYGVSVKGDDFVVLRTNKEVFVYQGLCPHESAYLSEGEVKGNTLVCPKHQWSFDITSGKKLGSPPACLKKYPISIEKGNVYLIQETLREEKQTKEKNTYSNIKDLPGPKGNFLTAMFPKVKLEAFHLALLDWAKEYGGIYRVKYISNHYIVISDPSMMTEVLKRRPSDFRRNDMESVFHEAGANGVFSAEGERWRKMRKISSKGLNMAHIQNFFPSISKITGRLLNLLDNYAQSAEPLEIKEILMRYTVDVTSELIFGIDMNTLEKGSDAIQEDLNIVLPGFMRRVFSPVPYWKYIKPPIEKRYEQALKRVKDEIRRCISITEQRMEEDRNLHVNPTNFMEAMLSKNPEEKEPKNISENDIIANSFNMLLAGEDTTANSLAWAIVFMANNSQVQQNAQKEADRLLVNNDHIVRYEDTRNYNYINAINLEALRIRGAVPFLDFAANHDTEVHGFSIPKDTKVICLTRGPGLDSQHFPSPEKFNPDRWIENPKLAGGNNFYLPFGGGPRFCPGRSLALIEMSMVLSMICRHFTIELVTPFEEIKDSFFLASGPSPFEVKLKRRTD